MPLCIPGLSLVTVMCLLAISLYCPILKRFQSAVPSIKQTDPLVSSPRAAQTF